MTQIETFKPDNVDNAVEIIAWVADRIKTLNVFSGQSKSKIGRPIQTDYNLDLSNISGVIDYDPAELVITARAGTPLVEIKKLLSENNQMLSFEPPDLGLLNGVETASATLAGVYATNFSGSRRIQAGSVRDSALGICAISGRGEIFKSGGRVIKNVSGYDLSKGLTGSWGTLAVITELSFKVLPLPQSSRTLVIFDLTVAEATKAMSKGMGSYCDLSSSAYLPAQVVSDFRLDYLSLESSVTLFRIEGFEPSVKERLETLKKTLNPLSSRIIELNHPESIHLWDAITEGRIFCHDLSSSLWRLSVSPMNAPDAIKAICDKIQGVRFFLDWAGGLIWLEVNEEETTQVEEAIRATIVSLAGGYATLLRASPSVRESTDLFQNSISSVASLSSRLKKQFDPQMILNPGRIWRGI